MGRHNAPYGAMLADRRHSEIMAQFEKLVTKPHEKLRGN
jgi:hypothetical protein